MKNNLTRILFSLLIIIAVAFTAFTQQGKDKNDQKGQQQNQGKKDQRDNRGKAGVKDDRGNHGNKEHKEVSDDQVPKDGKNNNGRNDDKMDKGNKNPDHGYKWDRATFKDRGKIRGGEKVTICHKFNRDNEPAVTIRVSSKALKAHMDHGDRMGDCPAIRDSRFSDIFLRKRNDYYNNLQESQEQVLYSRSMLDYALERLANSRSQLATYQHSNMPAADIRRKQDAVVELEQNVSLLETLLGAAVNMLANKLQ